LGFLKSKVSSAIDPTLTEFVFRRNTDLGLPARDLSLWAEELKSLAAVMRNTFYLAVAVSPLVILQSKKMDTEAIRRDYLIGVRAAASSLGKLQLNFTFSMPLPWETKSHSLYAKQRMLCGFPCCIWQWA
jgi:hypothetical protein